jgi:ribosomal protein S12 methylthiotransferase
VIPPKPPLAAIVTLGCPKNEADSENLVKMLAEAGIGATDLLDEAGVILVNTCGFIRDAKEESIGEILALAAQKGVGRRLVVFGCLAQRYREELLKEMPEIDALWGVGREREIVDYCVRELFAGSAVEGRAGVPSKFAPGGAPPSIFASGGTPPGAPHAYIKIAEGCNRACTFCVIPSIRGRFTSISPDDILRRAEEAVAGGKKELVLVAQDITSYAARTGYTLVELLKDMASISGDFWIRLLYLYPTALTDELLSVVKNEPKICKYLDIPFQHSEDAVLKAMGRTGSRKRYLSLVELLRKLIPGIALRTTLITGFPGESEDHFRGLCDFVREAGFERLGVFAYSDEEGTPARALDAKTPAATAKKRLDRLMRLQAEISYEKNAALVGRTFQALIDSHEGALALGRLYSHAPEIDGNVIIKSQSRLEGFLRVEITGAYEYDLEGRVAAG